MPVHPTLSDVRRSFAGLVRADVKKAAGSDNAVDASEASTLRPFLQSAFGDLGYVTCVENLVSEEGDSTDYLGAVLATNLFERRRGEWRMIHHHASPFSSDEADLPEGPLH